MNVTTISIYRRMCYLQTSFIQIKMSIYQRTDRIRGIRGNGRIRGIFQLPRYHLRKVILELDKYLKGL